MSDAWRDAVTTQEVWTNRPLPQAGAAQKAQRLVVAAQLAVVRWALAHRWVSAGCVRQAVQKELWPDFVRRLGGTGAVYTRCQRFHTDPSRLQAALARQAILLDAYQHVSARVKAPTVAQAMRYYLAHQNFYRTPPAVLARVITVSTMTQARAIVGQLRHGARFAPLAQKLSTDRATKEVGGSLGWVRVGAPGIPTWWQEALQTDKIGTPRILSDPPGYAIVEVQAKKAGSTLPFSAVKAAIQADLWNQARQQAFQRWAEQLVMAHPMPQAEHLSTFRQNWQKRIIRKNP